MNALAAYGLLANALIFGAIAALLPLGTLRPRAALAATAIALLAGLAPVMHGLLGPPSVTLLLLAILQLADRTPSPLSYRPALGLLVFAIFFYPAALGWGAFDPYALGYQPWPLLAALVPLAAVLCWRRLNAWLLILSIDLAAWTSGLFANLWDVLFDPLLVLLALLIVLRQQAIRIIASRRR